MKIELETKFNIGDNIWFVREKRRVRENWDSEFVEPVGIIKYTIVGFHVDHYKDKTESCYVVQDSKLIYEKEILAGKSRDRKYHIVTTEDELIKKIEELMKLEAKEE